MPETEYTPTHTGDYTANNTEATGDILAAFTEFTLLADRLRMAQTERQSILGVPDPVWAALTAGQARLAQVAGPAHLRRLRYALGLLRREALNGAASVQ